MIFYRQDTEQKLYLPLSATAVGPARPLDPNRELIAYRSSRSEKFPECIRGKGSGQLQNLNNQAIFFPQQPPP